MCQQASSEANKLLNETVNDILAADRLQKKVDKARSIISPSLFNAKVSESLAGIASSSFIDYGPGRKEYTYGRNFNAIMSQQSREAAAAGFAAMSYTPTSIGYGNYGGGPPPSNPIGPDRQWAGGGYRGASNIAMSDNPRYVLTSSYGHVKSGSTLDRLNQQRTAALNQEFWDSEQLRESRERANAMRMGPDMDTYYKRKHVFGGLAAQRTNALNQEFWDDIRKKEQTEAEAVRASQIRRQNMMFAGQSIAAFGGAEVGAFLGAFPGGGLPPIRGALTGMAGGLGLGTSIGMMGGPLGMLAGGAAGALAGGGMGLATGGIEMTFSLLTSAFGNLLSMAKTTASYIVDKGMEYERVLAKFGVLAGSPASGRELYGTLEQMSLKSPYSIGQYSSNAELLMGYGVDPKSTPKVLSQLSNIAGGDSTRLQRLALAYGQVLSQGRLQGQEVRQFSEAGVGAADFARTMGVSTATFRSMMETGTLSPEVMVDTIARLTSGGGRFSGINERTFNTVSGRYNALLGTLEMGGRRFGESIFDNTGIAGMLGSATGFLQKGISYAPQVGEMAGQGMKSLVDFGDRFVSAITPGLEKAAGYTKDFVDWLQKGVSVLPTWEEFGVGFAKGIEFAKDAFKALVDLMQSSLPVLRAVGEAGFYLAKGAILFEKYTTGNIVGPGAKVFDDAYNLVDVSHKGFSSGMSGLQDLSSKMGSLEFGKNSISFGGLGKHAVSDLLGIDTNWYNPGDYNQYGNYGGTTRNGVKWYTPSGQINPMLGLAGGLGGARGSPILPANPEFAAAVGVAAGTVARTLLTTMPDGEGFGAIAGGGGLYVQNRLKNPKMYTSDPLTGLYGGPAATVIRAIEQRYDDLPDRLKTKFQSYTKDFTDNNVLGSIQFSQKQQDLEQLFRVGGLSQGAYSQGVYKEFLSASKNVTDMLNTQPSSAGYGSAKALEIIQGGMFQQETTPERIASILEAMKLSDEQIANDIKTVAEYFKANPPVPLVVGVDVRGGK